MSFTAQDAFDNNQSSSDKHQMTQIQLCPALVPTFESSDACLERPAYPTYPALRHRPRFTSEQLEEIHQKSSISAQQQHAHTEYSVVPNLIEGQRRKQKQHEHQPESIDDYDWSQAVVSPQGVASESGPYHPALRSASVHPASNISAEVCSEHIVGDSEKDRIMRNSRWKAVLASEDGRLSLQMGKWWVQRVNLA